MFKSRCRGCEHVLKYAFGVRDRVWVDPCWRECIKDAVEAGWGVRATVSESERIIGLRDVSKFESDSSFVQSINSSMGVGMSACARAVCALLAAASAPLSCTPLALLSPASAALAL